MRKRAIALLSVGAIVGTGAAWLALGAPSSVSEARFHYRLKAAAAASGSTLNLAALMPGEWELVCSVHCYDGPLRVAKYARTYPAVSACQDRAWGLVFIASDGS